MFLVVYVMGINGKMLMLCMIEWLLCELGLCIGCFMSLYFIDVCECIVFDGEFVSVVRFVVVWDDVVLYFEIVDECL